MGRFVEVKLNRAAFNEGALFERVAAACPVDVFSFGRGELAVRSENEDECTLCGLCLLKGPPGGVRVRRLYGSGRELDLSEMSPASSPGSPGITPGRTGPAGVPHDR